MSTILSLSHVSYLYSAKTPFEMQALHDVSMDFEEGRVTGIIGHTGSGKSTLVQMLNGLLTPTSGQVFFDGQDILNQKKELPSVRFQVGLVMQYPEYQLFDDTVRADIGFAPRNMGLSEKEIDERVAEAAAFVGLDESLLDKSPFDLSGGQKRRAAIAGVLAMRPRVLVLDEPAAGLDPRGRNEILSRLLEYRHERGASVILVSHSMEDMAHYCDKLVVMNHGEVFMQGSVGEVFRDAEKLALAGLSLPQIAKLADKLRAAGMPLAEGLCTVEDVRKALLFAFGTEGISC